MDVSDTELDSMFKTVASLTHAQGQIRLMPGAHQTVKAFTQFVCHQIKLRVDPATVTFLAVEAVMHIQQRTKKHPKEL